MTADWFFAALRHDRAVVLGSLTFVVALAWAWLLLGAGIDIEETDMIGGQMMLMLPEWSFAYGLVMFAMWAVMMVAMMLPSAAPVTLLIASIGRKRREAGAATGISTAPFVLGYLAVWLAFAAAATLLQWQLDAAELLSETMALASTLVAGGVLILAGIYQWTPLKQACLRHCRSPLQFLLHHWRDGALGAFVSGESPWFGDRGFAGDRDRCRLDHGRTVPAAHAAKPREPQLALADGGGLGPP